MKTKSNALGFLIVIIGLAAAAWTANALYNWKVRQAPHQAKAPVQFYAGMDKFLSNVSWMTLIQWQAESSQRQMTPDLARSLYNKLNSLTNLDPLFTDAYLNGALALAPFDPNLSVQLLDKAIDMGAGGNWKIPFYAGHVRATVSGDSRQAQRYFEMAAQDSEAPDYVHTALLRARCIAAGDKPVDSIRIWYEHFKSLPADNLIQRRIAASQIREYAASAASDIDGQMQSATDPTTRESMIQEQKWLRQVLAEVDAVFPAAPEVQTEEAPTTQPNI
jgi:hypothetical protein